MAGSEMFDLRTASLDDKPIGFGFAWVRVADLGVRGKTWEGALQGCDVEHLHTLIGPHRLSSKTTAGQHLEGDIVITKRAPTARGIDAQFAGSDALLIDGQEW
jgi:hypothetical protein